MTDTDLRAASELTESERDEEAPEIDENATSERIPGTPSWWHPNGPIY